MSGIIKYATAENTFMTIAKYLIMTTVLLALLGINTYYNMYYHEQLHWSIGEIYGCDNQTINYHLNGSAQTYCNSGIAKDDLDNWRQANALHEVISYNIMYLIDVILMSVYIIMLGLYIKKDLE